MLFEEKFKNIEKEEGENKNHFNPTIQYCYQLIMIYCHGLNVCTTPAPKSSYAKSLILFLNPHSKGCSRSLIASPPTFFFRSRN